MKNITSEISARHMMPLRMVQDAMMATRGRHGGRLIPVLLLDTSERPDVAEFIRLRHTIRQEGDVISQWGKIEEKGHDGTVALFLQFVRPIEIFFTLEFNIGKQGCIVEQALIGQGLYIAEATGPDDRFFKAPERPLVLAELPDTGFRGKWDSLFEQHVIKRLRNEGLGRSEAKKIAKSWIAKCGKLRWSKCATFIKRYGRTRN